MDGKGIGDDTLSATELHQMLTKMGFESLSLEEAKTVSSVLWFPLRSLIPPSQVVGILDTDGNDELDLGELMLEIRQVRQARALRENPPPSATVVRRMPDCAHFASLTIKPHRHAFPLSVLAEAVALTSSNQKSWYCRGNDAYHDLLN
jgi:hypothetical protein